MEGMQKITDDFYVDKSKPLGKGNFGTVYKGYHLSQNRIIAVKFMEKKILDKCPDYEREIIVMEDLAKIRHPNIMGYYGYEKNNEGLYCFIEFCSGGSLKQLASKRISQLKVLVLFRQLLDAMTYVNSLQKVHRDLKPENILLDENKQLKIADFGLARDINVVMTKGACTPLYAAPQVINLQPYNERCDVWSAGMILYEMLMGKEMFSHVRTKNQLLQQLSKFSTGKKISYPSFLHRHWEKITSMMLTFDKQKRASFSQVLSEFDRLRGEMQEDLEKKYGFDNPQVDEGLRITKTVSPYQSIPMKNGKVDMIKKLKQERSYNNLNNLRKYLMFYRIKSDFHNKLIKEFTCNTYSSLKNVYKYILMFLSASIFVSRLEDNLEQIKKKKISTPDGPLTPTDFEPVHQKGMVILLKDYANKHETSISKFKGIIQKQINSKILGSYMKREEEKKILQQTANVLKLIEEANQGKFSSEDEYLQLYLRVMNHKEVFVSNKDLANYTEVDVKTYVFIRIIGHMDTVFPNINYINDDYIRMKKQQIENMNKIELLRFVSEINSP